MGVLARARSPSLARERRMQLPPARLPRRRIRAFPPGRWHVARRCNGNCTPGADPGLRPARQRATEWKGTEAVRLIARMFAVAILAGGAVAGPVAAASASTSVTVEWVSDTGTYTQTYACSGTATHSGWYVDYVSNGCGDRVWLHQTLSGGGSNPYCINPGAEAYGLSHDYEQVQFSGTAATACDAGTDFQVGWVTQTGWVEPYSCVDGYTVSASAYVLTVQNNCNTRIWIHVNPDGSDGAVACVSPNTTWSGNELGTQVQVTANQAPCSAG
jgi:hypothetical protein